MKYFITILLLFTINESYSFVSSSSSISEGENKLVIGTQLERGVIEPNENMNSYQKASINIYRLKHLYGLRDHSFMNEVNFSTEFIQFTSVEEKVGVNLFYPSDKGYALKFGYSGDILHDSQKKIGLSFHLAPLREYNKNKFSNPRLDLFTFGINSFFELTDILFLKTLLHYGSGDDNYQNSSFLFEHAFGYRLDKLLHRTSTFSTGLLIEADTKERFDTNYDRIFSPLNRNDRIRAFKYGITFGFETAITQSLILNANYLQKIAGYDARATQVLDFNFGYLFK